MAYQMEAMEDRESSSMDVLADDLSSKLPPAFNEASTRRTSSRASFAVVLWGASMAFPWKPFTELLNSVPAWPKPTHCCTEPQSYRAKLRSAHKINLVFPVFGSPRFQHPQTMRNRSTVTSPVSVIVPAFCFLVAICGSLGHPPN